MNNRIEMIEQDLIDKIIGWLVTFFTAMIGGSAVIAVYLWKKEKNAEKVTITRKRILLSLFFGICGACFIAPMIVEYMHLQGGLATGVGFLSAFLANVILEIISNLMDSVKVEANSIVMRKIKKWFGHEDDIKKK